MSALLDLDDVASGNPAAMRELATLRARVESLAAQLRAAGEQEPVAHIDDLGHIQFTDGGKLKCGDRLYTRPTPPASAQDARDAERYRWLRSESQTGAVKTLLPLTRSHYVVVNESAYDYPTFDEAIDAAIAAAKGKKDGQHAQPVAVPEVSDSALLKAYTTASNGEILSHSWRPIFLRYARIGIAAILAAKEKK